MAGESGNGALNGDLSRSVCIDTQAMAWEPSPGGEVLRKRLHRVGPPESGQVTSLVRYPAGARFPAHDHPDGEEILVLAGIFSDEQGDWPAGSYLLNPEGFRHAPFSEEGCLLFVKLRQYSGSAREHVAHATDALAWEAGDDPAIETKTLYSDARHPDAMLLERWQPGAEIERALPGGAEILALSGSYEDERGTHAAQSWQRLPVDCHWKARSEAGCTLYVKTGGLAELRSGQAGARIRASRSGCRRTP